MSTFHGVMLQRSQQFEKKINYMFEETLVATADESLEMIVKQAAPVLCVCVCYFKVFCAVAGALCVSA